MRRRPRSAPPAHAIVCDVGDKAALIAALDAAIARSGPLDGLFLQCRRPRCLCLHQRLFGRSLCRNAARQRLVPVLGAAPCAAGDDSARQGEQCC